MSTIELRNFLFLHKIKQENFARMLGVSRQTVCYWCNGKRKIPQRVIDFCKDYKDDMYNTK